jgi:PAS domain S-box-containing protein
MARKTGLRWRVVAASSVAMALGTGALTVALVTAADMRAVGHELSRRLIPAAAAAVNLLDLYQGQQTWLRGYVTDGHPDPPAAFGSQSAQIRGVQDQIGQLMRGYGPATRPLQATVAAGQAWVARVADPQLADARRGDFAAARRLQADTEHTRPYVLAIRAAGAALQTQITDAQQTATDMLNGAQGVLLAALIVMCVLVSALVANTFTAVWFGLLRPFRALRHAMDQVTAGNYDTRIPSIGLSELAELGRGIDLMRGKLVAALAQRERAEQRFRYLFDAAPDAMIAVEPGGLIAMANARALQLFGYEAGDLIGQPVEMLAPPEARAALAAERAAYFAQLEVQSRSIADQLRGFGLRQDGGTFPAEITLGGLPMDSGMLVTAAIRDVSERLAADAERERLRAVAEEERVQRRVQQSQRLESLGQLVGGVAHDFNNLLNVIQGYADFSAEQVQLHVQEDSWLEPVLDDIEQVRVAAQQAIRLTRQLLTFARHEVTRPEVFDLNEAVQGAGQLLRRTLGEHIELVISTDPVLWRVKADRGQLEQVLVNLAVNARDAMPGGGRLTIDTGNAEVDAAYAAHRPTATPGRYARLRVADTGVGMDRATAERVFEPFFSTKPKGRGTGLGLATVYGIVTQAGGSIEIYSEVGMGTTVSVLLPATDEDAQPETAPAANPTTTAGRTRRS